MGGFGPERDFFSSPPTLAPVEDLLTAACSSIFPGAGTNQELALHCLHESRGDILVRRWPWWGRDPEGGSRGSMSAAQEPGLLAY